MTDKNSDKNPRKTTLHDLVLLHRYARSRLPGGELSNNKFALQQLEGNGSAYTATKSTLKGAVDRIEHEFGVFLLPKTLKMGDEPGRDISYWEEIPGKAALAALLGSSDDRNGNTDPAKQAGLTWKNQQTLTLDGEIFGELASIVAGYLALVRSATGRFDPPANDKRSQQASGMRRVGSGPRTRNSSGQRESFLEFLRNERRRLHPLVQSAFVEGGSVFDLDSPAPSGHQDGPHPSDTIAMDVSPPARRPDDNE